MSGRYKYSPGEKVLYRCEKHGLRPARHAEAVYPESKGEEYRYWVTKYWIVDQVLPDGRIVVRTRRGKMHPLDPSDPNLRPAGWWDRMRYASRFPQRDVHPTHVEPKDRRTSRMPPAMQ